MIVANCQSGWASDVFAWDRNHVESGSTPNYQPYAACDATYSRAVYDSELVRYYEDSTLVSAITNPTETPAQYLANLLSPAKVASMTNCGVNLFGFDQILPDDGRLAASVWSWATGEPVAADGACAAQGSDGRWRTTGCGGSLPAACSVAGGGWVLSTPTTFAGAGAACTAAGGTFDLPRDGYSNSVLHAAAGPQSVWVNYQLTG
jgi:hypothetical protein